MSNADAARNCKRLFAYGTLMFPQVFTAVCRTSRPSYPAVLHGYVRRQVRGHSFPGIVPRAAATVAGCVIEPIETRLWRLLDTFESDFYERRTVSVESEHGAQMAWTYIVAPTNRHVLTSGDWSPERFCSTSMSAYLARYT